MKRLAVIGAGVVGVATALELARAGHDTVVFDRRATIAEEASFGCTGLAAHGWPWPWPIDGDPVPAWGSPAPRGWIDRLRRRTSGMDDALLAMRSQQLRQLILLGEDMLTPSPSRTEPDNDGQEDSRTDEGGLLVFWRREEGHDLVRSRLDVLADAGLPIEGLDAGTVQALEPGLNPDTPLARALRIGQAFCAVPRQAAMQWRDAAQAAGVRLEMTKDITAITAGSRPAVRWRDAGTVSPQEASFDGVIVCAGAGSSTLLRTAGWRGQSWLLQGKSLSAPLSDPLFAPRHPVFDADRQALIVADNGRLRVAGLFEPARPSPASSAREAYAGLYQVLEDWFPGAARLRGQHQGTVQHWEAVIGRTRDGLPRIGALGLPGIWVNMDHGTQGWATAPGSARLLATLVSGTPSPVDPSPFTPLR